MFESLEAGQFPTIDTLMEKLSIEIKSPHNEKVSKQLDGFLYL